MPEKNSQSQGSAIITSGYDFEKRKKRIQALIDTKLGPSSKWSNHFDLGLLEQQSFRILQLED